MRPSLGGVTSPHYGVALLGEALGEQEAEQGSPFVGRAGFTLTRLLEWAGFDRSGFDIYNSVWCRPPDNALEGQSFEQNAISHCQSAHWQQLLVRSQVLVPMGNVATGALLGRKGILSLRGYVAGGEGRHVLPTVHPSFIQRGQSKYSAAFINDIQKAVELASHGLPPQIYDYTLDPTPAEAYRWASTYREVLANNPATYCAYDIETPGKGEDEGEVADEDDPSFFIYRIGFAYKPYHAMSIPWDPTYLAAIKLLLESDGPKVVWNKGFDNPRIEDKGVRIKGVNHDGMVAWHILHSDLPKGLGFVATFTCPWQGAWKHLSHARPAFYNATDADVELRSMLHIEEQLRANGMWSVYQNDVLDLEPILVHMSDRGMPIDREVRYDRAVKLSERRRTVLDQLRSSTPLNARRIEHVYINTPKDTTGLLSRDSTRIVPVCASCGLEKPRKDHFKRFVKKSNPCADGTAVDREIPVVEYYRLGEFTPSRDQLIRYNGTMNRPCPTKYDKKTKTRKVSFDEKAIKEMIRKYQGDPLYENVLVYRELDKLAGTYIGRPADGMS